MIAILTALRVLAPIRVACIGDSITAGVGASSPAMNYPAQLQSLLGPGYDVRAFAKSGAAMLHVGSRPIESQLETPMAYAFEPQIVVIMLGSNDANPANWERAANAFVPTYETFLRSWRSVPTHPRVFVCVPPPVFKGHIEQRGRFLDSEVVPLVRQVARETGAGLIDVHGALEGHEADLPDGLHPNDAGYGIVATTVYESVVDQRIAKAGWRIVSASSAQEDEGPAKNAIDGDPDTFWHSRYEPTAARPPHVLTVDMGSIRLIQGFRYLPRQDGGENGRARQVRFEVATDLRRWTLAKEIELPPGPNPNRITLDSPVRARYFRFSILTGAFGSAAEIDVLPTTSLRRDPRDESPSASSDTVPRRRARP